MLSCLKFVTVNAFSLAVGPINTSDNGRYRNFLLGGGGVKRVGCYIGCGTQKKAGSSGVVAN